MYIVLFLGTCVSEEIGNLAETKGRRFPYSKCKKLIKEFDPDMYRDLCLDMWNPWDYATNLKQGKYLHMVHSATDYLFEVAQ